MLYYIVISILTLVIIVLLLPEAVIFCKKRAIQKYFLGRIHDEVNWKNKVTNISEKWLLKTPVVKKTDDHSFWVFNLFKDNSKKSIQVWQSASLYIALYEYNAIHFDQKVKKYLAQYRAQVNTQFDLHEVQDSDYGILAFALLDYSEFESFTKAMLNYAELNCIDGILKYKSSINQTAFVDTLGFVCPFLTKYGVIFGDDKYIEQAKQQFKLYFKYGLEHNSGLPFHAFSIDSHIQRGICDWARGLAWLLIGLMDSYKVLKEAGIDDEFYKTNIEKYADILIKYQRENGSFTWQLLSGYTTDSSAIAVFGWYLACCSSFFQKDEYLFRAKKCREFLMMQTRNSGVIDYCQGDTISIGVYSRSFDIMPFAQGFALRLQLELDVAEKDKKKDK